MFPSCTPRTLHQAEHFVLHPLRHTTQVVKDPRVRSPGSKAWGVSSACTSCMHRTGQNACPGAAPASPYTGASEATILRQKESEKA